MYEATFRIRIIFGYNSTLIIKVRFCSTFVTCDFICSVVKSDQTMGKDQTQTCINKGVLYI